MGRMAGGRAVWQANGGIRERREPRTAGAALADQALAVMGLADDGHHFLRVVDDTDQ